MKKTAYFMKPRVMMDTYLQGWKSHKTLILGASLPCSLQDCPMKEACTRYSRDFDKACFWYRRFPDRADLCLSNSNFIEVDSFIEGNSAHYFADFTKFMIQKQDEIPLEIRAPFWNHVAFYNYDQNIHFTLNDDDSSDHAHDTEENYQAFLEVLDELQPEVIYVWFEEVRDILVGRQIEGLREIEQLNVNGITVYRFIYHIAATPHPEEVLSLFLKTFSKDMEPETYPESYLLHALYRARFYHQELPYTPLDITGEMIDFAAPYAWDETFYRFLIQSLQKQIGLDVARDFIQRKWTDANDFHVTSNFECGIAHNSPLYGFSPSELSFFTLMDRQTIARYELQEPIFSFVYLDENTEKRVLTSLLNATGGRNAKAKKQCFTGLFIPVDDVPLYEVTILKTQRVKSIHWLQQEKPLKEPILYIELTDHAPNDFIELYRGLKKVSNSCYGELAKRENGKRLLPRELSTDNKDIDLSPLDVLCRVKWIQVNEDGHHYSILTADPVVIHGIKQVNGKILPAKCLCNTDPQIKGLVYTYLMYKLHWTQKQLVSIFPEIPNIDQLKDHKRRALECFKNSLMCIVDGNAATTVCGRLIEQHITQLLKEGGHM